MSGPSFSDFEAQDRRLVLLRALQNAAQYKANAYLLRRFCEHLGHVASEDRIAADLAWLQEQGLVVLDEHMGVTVANLTPRGLDVAAGSATVPGVARPRPV